MSAIVGTLTSSIAGRGFVLRRGIHTGDLDAAGVVWLMVQLARRVPGQGDETRRIGVHSSRFSYLESPDTAVIPNPRAAIVEKIKAAEAAAAGRFPPVTMTVTAVDRERGEVTVDMEPVTKRKPGRPRKS